MRTRPSEAFRGVGERALHLVLRNCRAEGLGTARAIAPDAKDAADAFREDLGPLDAPNAEASDGVALEGAQVRKSLSVVATRAVIAACFLGALPLVGFGTWAMIQVDRQAVEREERLLRRGLEAATAEVSYEQESVTFWNDAVIRARARDQEWLANNLGEWMHDYYGHDRAYVLDERDQAFDAMLDGDTHPAAAFAGDAEQIGPLIKQLRSQMSDAKDLGGLAARDITMIDGHPAVVSVKPIVPESDRIAFEPRGAYLHVAVQYVDGTFLAALEDRFMLNELRLVAHEAKGRQGITLRDAGSGPLRDIVWRPTQPGRNVIRRTLPGVLVSALALFGLIGGLLLRLRREAGRRERDGGASPRAARHAHRAAQSRPLQRADRRGARGRAAGRRQAGAALR